ncbi:MAG: asparagine synthase-related protein [Nitrososphaeria archaeon]
MESRSLARTNGYFIVCGTESVSKIAERSANFLSYRKRLNVRFFEGSTFTDRLSGKAASKILCFFPLQNTNDSTSVLHGRIFDFEKNYHKILKMKKLVTEKEERSASVDIDGDFSVTFFSDDHIFALRSPISSKPLFFAKTSKNFLLSSDPYVLNFIGVQHSYIPSGSFLYFRSDDTKKLLVQSYYSPPRSESFSKLDQAVDAVKSASEYSIRKNLEGVKDVALSFSGGLDSAILAKLAMKYSNPTLITASVGPSHDLIRSKDVSMLFSLEHVVLDIDENVLAKKFTFLKTIFEKENIINMSIAILFNLVAEEASRLGLGGLIVGQGADELFGGYRRYVDVINKGESALDNALRKDFYDLHSRVISRDETSISMFADPIMPYLNRKIAEVSSLIPLRFKVEKAGGNRKVVLRAVAESLGLPKDVFCYPKKAMQYSSGIQKCLLKTLRKL